MPYEALKEIHYGGKTHAVGDPVAVAAKDVRILTALGKIGEAAPKAKAEKPKDDSNPQKGKYMTKDMKAEG